MALSSERRNKCSNFPLNSAISDNRGCSLCGRIITRTRHVAHIGSHKKQPGAIVLVDKRGNVKIYKEKLTCTGGLEASSNNQCFGKAHGTWRLSILLPKPRELVTKLALSDKALSIM